MTVPFTTWDEVLADAGARSYRATSLLSAICIAAQPFVVSSLNADRPGGFPRGTPRKDVVRQAATLLCDITSGREDARSRGRRALGLICRLYRAQRSKIDVHDTGEFDQALRDCSEAIAEAAAAHDPLTLAICANRRALVLRSLGRSVDAVDSNRQAIDAMATVALFDTDTWLHSDAPFLVTDSAPGLGYKVMFRARLGLIRRLLTVPDITAAAEANNDLVSFTEAHKDVSLNSFAWALTSRARVERAARDTGAFLSTEAELQALAAESTDKNDPINRYWLNCAADNANHLNDFGRLEWATRQRVAARATNVLKVDMTADALTVDTFADLVARAHALGDRQSLTNLGNAAHDVVKAQFFSGVLQHDRAARTGALLMLNAAENAWEGFADNGVQSLRLMRGQIALLESDPPLGELTDVFVSVNALATNENTARRALVAAVRSGVVGSSVVRARLDELLGEVDRVRAAGEFAVLSGLSAEWWYRVNTAGGSPEQAVDWDAGERTALTAVALLRPAGVSLDPELEATCWYSAALSLAAAGGPVTEQLERLLWAVRCVSELMVTVAGGVRWSV